MTSDTSGLATDLGSLGGADQAEVAASRTMRRRGRLGKDRNVDVCRLHLVPFSRGSSKRPLPRTRTRTRLNRTKLARPSETKPQFAHISCAIASIPAQSADVQLERPDDERARRGGEGADDADRDVLRAAGVPW